MRGEHGKKEKFAKCRERSKLSCLASFCVWVCLVSRKLVRWLLVASHPGQWVLGTGMAHAHGIGEKKKRKQKKKKIENGPKRSKNYDVVIGRYWSCSWWGRFGDISKTCICSFSPQTGVNLFPLPFPPTSPVPAPRRTAAVVAGSPTGDLISRPGTKWTCEIDMNRCEKKQMQKTFRCKGRCRRVGITMRLEMRKCKVMRCFFFLHLLFSVHKFAFLYRFLFLFLHVLSFTRIGNRHRFLDD